MNEKVGVVFESLSSTELCEVCAQFVDFQSCDVARKVLDVRSDIAQTTRGATPAANHAHLQFLFHVSRFVLNKHMLSLFNDSVLSAMRRLPVYWLLVFFPPKQCL